MDAVETHLPNVFPGGKVQPGGNAFRLMPYGPRPVFAPEDGAGSGDGGSDAGAGAGDDKTKDNANGGGAEGAGQDQKPVRPDYIPETFWDADKGFKADDLSALVAFKAEADSKAAGLPESPDKYEVRVPQEFKLPEGITLPNGPDGKPLDINTLIKSDDARLEAARNFAHQNGFDQAQFEGLVGMGVALDLAEKSRFDAAIQAEVEKLGGKGQERVNSVMQWLGAKVGGELAAAVEPMIMTAKQIQAFEAIMRLNRGVVAGNPGAGRDGKNTGEPDDAAWDKMSDKDRIQFARDANKK